MSSANDKKISEAVTNEMLTDKFIQDLGQKARVERIDLANDRTENLRAVVKDIGQDLLDAGIAPKGMQYRGSLTVHVYSSTVLNAAAFLTLNHLGTLDGGMADGALRELNNTTKTQFGKSRQKLRSGF